MNTESIKRIRENKQAPCVSVIIPTHKISPERAVDPIEVSKIIKQVSDNIIFKYGIKKGAELVAKLEVLQGTIDFTHGTEGLGLFVSPEISEIVKFPFPVVEKTTVGNRFETRDLVYLDNYLEEYFLLSISLNETKLFRGNGKVLTEIRGDDFPRKYVDDHLYERPFLANSFGYGLKNVEKDQSVILEIRFQQFLKETDKLLSPYLNNNFIPLIIAGVKEELGFFQKETLHNSRIAGKVIGNYTYRPFSEFGEMAFEEIQTHRQKTIAGEIKKMQEAIGRELAVTGIRSVWKAALEGKGLLLMVEKDFAKPGFVKRDDPLNLYLMPPVENHNTFGDAVETIMETVLDKNGKIMMVENGTLTDHDQIAMILRYT